jgi:septal ring factor EnvC (AmiA/AmiB activator)
MDSVDLATVFGALIAGLTTSQAWGYWKKKLDLKKENDTEYKYECRARIEKLEDLLEEASREKHEMRKTILELSVKVAELTAKIQLLEDKNKG